MLVDTAHPIIETESNDFSDFRWLIRFDLDRTDFRLLKTISLHHSIEGRSEEGGMKEDGTIHRA